MKRYFLVTAILSLTLGIADQAVAEPIPNRSPLVLTSTYIMKSVPAGPYSDYLTLDIVGNRLFATPQAAKAVAVLDAKSGRVIRMISGLNNPHGLYFDQATRRLFVADSVSGSVHVFSGDDLKPEAEISLRKGADWLVYDPASNRIYVNNGGDEAGETSSVISLIDPRTLKATADITVNAPGLEASVIDGKAQRLFVDIPSKSEVSVVDLRSRTVIANWPIGYSGRSTSLALDPEGRRLFVGCRDDDMHGSIVVLDADRGTVLARLPIGGWVDSVYFDHRRQRVYASTGVGYIETFQAQSRDQYARLPKVPTAVMAKTSFYSPSLDVLFVSVPHLGATAAKILVFKPSQ